MILSINALKKAICNGKFLLIFLFFSYTTSILGQEDTTHITPSILLPEMQVTTTRPTGENTFSVSNINRESIKEKQGNGSVNNLLDQVPGMVTTSDAGTGLGYSYMRIRGIDQTRINVTINGIALNDAESQGSWFVNLPDFGSHVQNLEVQRGAGTSNNGASAFGATMNFKTLTPSATPFVQISSSAGSFYTFRNAVDAGTGLIKNRFSANVGYSNVLSRGYIDNSKAKLHSAFFVANYRILNEKKNKEYGTLQFNLLYGNEKTGLAWNGVPSELLKTNRTYNSCGLYYDADSNLYHYDNQTDNYQQTHSQLHYNFQRAINQIHNIRLHAALHLTRGIGYYEEYQDNIFYADYGLVTPYTLPADAITRKCMDNYFYGGIFNFEHTIKNKYTWVIGGAINRYQGNTYGTMEWLEHNSNIDKGAHWFFGTGDKRQYNIYGKFIVNFDKKTEKNSSFSTLYADLQYRGISYYVGGNNESRIDITNHFLWNFINPKLGFNHQWSKNGSDLLHEIYFTFSVANREPTRSDLIDTDIEHRPNPETLYDFEAGYLLHGKKYQLATTAYFMYYVDQLVLTGEINSVGAPIMTNADQSFRTGIEIISQYKPLKWFTWKINGTFSLNKILNYTEFIDDWDSGEQRQYFIGTTNISFSPNIVANNEFIFTPVKNFNISWVTKFVSRQYIDNSSRKEYSIDPYCVNNLQLSYTIHTKPIPEIGLYFQINNIFHAQYESNAWLYRYYLGNAEYRMDGYFPQAGINFMGGITLKF